MSDFAPTLDVSASVNKHTRSFAMEYVVDVVRKVRSNSVDDKADGSVVERRVEARPART